jgi:hypothetical protein
LLTTNLKWSLLLNVMQSSLFANVKQTQSIPLP